MHVSAQAIKAWQAGWMDASGDLYASRQPPATIGQHPSAYILGYFTRREHAALLRTTAELTYDSALAHFMENYEL